MRTDLHRPIQTQEGIVGLSLQEDGVHLLDQTRLPAEERWVVLDDIEGLARAIETLTVRGAPAIGGAAALGQAHLARQTHDSPRALLDALSRADARLRKTRPTAVNLFHALDAILAAARAAPAGDLDALRAAVVDAAERVCTEDAARCQAIGRAGAELLGDDERILTICHTGALATCGQGTALGVLKTAHAAGKSVEVFALETRPLLQGARLTAWECEKLGLPVTLLTDSMAAYAMARLGITRAIAGADRIAKNGDTANKIGTYMLAQLCRAHRIPFHIAAPSSTFDDTLEDGRGIVIEERHPDEVRAPRGTPFAPATVAVWNPAFDVTPHSLITSIITEDGVWTPPGA